MPTGKSIIIFIGTILCTALLLTPVARAHFIWLNLGKQPAAPNQPLPVSIGWGHHFPASEQCPVANLEEIRVLGPAKLAKLSPLEYTLTPAKTGAYVLLAAYKPGFLTKTPEGYKHQDKTGLKEAISCFRYDLRTKALVAVGGGAGYDRRAGDILELAPRADPFTLKPGEKLPVLVLFKGEPLAGAEAEATYAGFDDKGGKFAWQGQSDAQGLLQVPLLAAGPQLIAVTHKLAYPDRAKCDQLLYKYTLTFNLR